MTRPEPDSGVLRALAGWDLPGSIAIDLPDEPYQRERLFGKIGAQRLSGLLLAAAEAGDVVLSETEIASVIDRHRPRLLWCLHLEQRLLQVLDWFDDAGVSAVVLKGPAIAHLDEPDPSLRIFNDLDLLVGGEHIEEATRVLTSRGYTRPWPERRPGFDRRFAKGVTLTGPDRVEIDLHRSLCDGAFSFRLPLPRLFENTQGFELGGRQARGLGPVARLLHAAIHAVLGSPAPRRANLRDLARYLSRADLQPRDVIPEAGRWRCESVLAIGVRLCFEQVSFEASGWRSWVDRYRISSRELAVVERHRREGSGMGPAKIDALRELDGWRDRISYALAVGIPSSEHLRGRGMRRRDLLGSG